MFDFKENIQQMRQNYKDKSQKFTDKIKVPMWMPKNDVLMQTFYEKELLIKQGKVFYASLVQANSLLFKRFPSTNCPANIVFSTDEYFDENPHQLAAAAAELYSYKNTADAPPELKMIVDSITGEQERLLNVVMPFSIANGKRIYFTTILVFKKHLPKKMLVGNIFPVLANPDLLKSSIILPQRYWTEIFKEYYSMR